MQDGGVRCEELSVGAGVGVGARAAGVRVCVRERSIVVAVSGRWMVGPPVREKGRGGDGGWVSGERWRH